MTDFLSLYPYAWNGAAPLWLSEVDQHVDLIVAPTEEPVTLDAAVAHLRAMNTQDTATGGVIDGLRTVVRRQCEYFTRRALPPQTCELVLDRFPDQRYPPTAGQHAGLYGAWFGLGRHAGVLLLPRPPLIEVISIVYVDEAGADQTLDPSTYQVDIPVGPLARPGRVRPVPGTAWPTTQHGRLDAVRLRYRCGYVTGGSPETMDVPADLTHGQLVMLSELYKVRSESVPLGSTPALIRAKALWQPYRVGA
jgi:hypothetical protein